MWYFGFGFAYLLFSVYLFTHLDQISEFANKNAATIYLASGCIFLISLLLLFGYNIYYRHQIKKGNDPTKNMTDEGVTEIAELIGGKRWDTVPIKWKWVLILLYGLIIFFSFFVFYSDYHQAILD